MSPRGRPVVPPWAWPSLVGLDAPTVAVAWSWALAHAVGASFSWSDGVVVGLATMAAYLLDRRLDVRLLAGDRPATLRHAWVAHHRRLTTTLATCAAIGAAAAAFALPLSSLAWGFVVAVGAALVVLAPGRRASGGRATVERTSYRFGVPSRSVTVGLVFAAAAALPASDGDWPALLPALVSLAAVAGLNVRMIADWEEHLDDGSNGPVLRASVPAWAVAGSLAMVMVVARPWLAGLGSALAVAAALLATIDVISRTVDARRHAAATATVMEARHLAVDLALLAALVALPFG